MPEKDKSEPFTVDHVALSKQFPSDSEMTTEEMHRFNLEHARKFMEADFDGIMDESIIDEAVWEFYPNRIRVSGKEALRRYHELNFQSVIAQVDPRNGGDTREQYSNLHDRNIISHEMSAIFTRSNGETFRGYFNAVIPFANGRMAGERIYMCQQLASFFEESLGKDFFDLSGVERF